MRDMPGFESSTGLIRRTALKALLMGAAVLGSARPAVAAPPRRSMRRQTLWYRQPARVWTEALPVGNGRIGAMVFGGTDLERLQLNEDTLYSGGPYDPVNPDARAALPEVRNLIFAGHYPEAEALANRRLMAQPLKQAAYQTLGELEIRVTALAGQDAANYRRELDLDTAVAVTEFTAGGVRIRREVLASPTDQIIAVRLSCDRPGGLSCEIGIKSPHAEHTVLTEGDNTLVLQGRNGPHAQIPGALRFEGRIKAVVRGGETEAIGAALRISAADEVLLLIALATGFRRFDDVSGDPEAANRSTLAAAERLDFAALAARSSGEHQRLFRRVTIDLGRSAADALPTDERVRRSEQLDDPGLAALYFDYGRYLLIASSRPGTQPANLQGIWNDSLTPPWESKYTVNINTEMNYWPAEPCNLPECVEPLVQMVRDLAVTGARTAREMYGARGWVVHHNTDLWRATAPIDGAQWGLWPTGGAWLCTHLWEHYRYNPDQEFLTSVYPVMRGAAEFFLDTLQTDPASGYLVTNPSLSPENSHGHGSSLIYGPAMDMQLLRDLFEQVGQAAAILGIDSEFAARLAIHRARLLPDRIGGQGQLQEWPQDWDAQAEEQQHRHVSHLYGLFPSRQIDPDRTPALAAAARVSLEQRGDRATGWATAWRINLWARLRDGNRAHAILKLLLGPERTYPNLFDAHPPFQIDGNFGGTSGICAMLVQADESEIALLPALPAAWPEGSIRGLRVVGGATLDLAWRRGRVTSAVLRGGAPGIRTVITAEGRASVTLGPDRTVRLTARNFA